MTAAGISGAAKAAPAAIREAAERAVSRMAELAAQMAELVPAADSAARAEIGFRIRDDEQGWYNDIDMSRLLPKEVEQARAAMVATPDACPPPRIVTVLEGTLL